MPQTFVGLRRYMIRTQFQIFLLFSCYIVYFQTDILHLQEKAQNAH